MQAFIPHLLGHARAVLRCEGLAWDAVQESLIRLWQSVRETGDLPHSVGPWLCKAVILRSLYDARSLRRRMRREQRVGSAEATTESPAGRLENVEFREKLEAELSRLPTDFREVFVLREFEGLDYSRIAERTGVPPGTVRSRLRRARLALRTALSRGLCHGELPSLPRTSPMKPR